MRKENFPFSQEKVFLAFFTSRTFLWEGVGNKLLYLFEGGGRLLIARCDQKVLQRQIPGEVLQEHVCLVFLISIEADMGTWASGILERKEEEGELNAKLLR